VPNEADNVVAAGRCVDADVSPLSAIRVMGPCIAMGAGAGGDYMLASRDLIVNDMEIAVEGAQLDGMICLSSCDKTPPAHLMAAGMILTAAPSATRLPRCWP
jgi:dihydroxyacid dehydratase/phosphogluconate dehydratase